MKVLAWKSISYYVQLIWNLCVSWYMAPFTSIFSLWKKMAFYKLLALIWKIARRRYWELIHKIRYKYSLYCAIFWWLDFKIKLLSQISWAGSFLISVQWRIKLNDETFVVTRSHREYSPVTVVREHSSFQLSRRQIT